MRDDSTELAILRDAIRDCAARCDIDPTGMCPHEILQAIGDKGERQSAALLLARERGVELEQRLRDLR